MGYYTDYYLEAIGYEKPMASEDAEKLMDHLEAFMPFDWVDKMQTRKNGYLVNASLNCAKWYENRQDMYELSLQFPDVLFTLSGNGEANSDIWRHYWLNGEWQSNGIEIVETEFNPDIAVPYQQFEEKPAYEREVDDYAALP